MSLRRAFLLHGFLGSRIQMLPFANAMSRGGWKVQNYAYESTRFSIEEHASKLANVLKDESFGKLGFVTHSFGGVVLRAALSHPACPPEARAARIVLVAPPLGGSALARRMKSMPRALRIVVEAVMGEKSGAQLRNTEAVQFARSFGGFPEESRILLVVGNAGRVNPLIPTPSDGVVTVSEVTSGMINAHRRMTLTLSHNALVFDPRVMSAAREFLDGNDEVGEAFPAQSAAFEEVEVQAQETSTI